LKAVVAGQNHRMAAIRVPAPAETVARLDRTLGDGLEAAIRWHHRHRLRRAGWESALDAPAGFWAAGAPPPTRGNALDVHLDGARAFARMAGAIRGAERRVMLAGWFFTARFGIEREPELIELRALLAEVAERADVYVLSWAGAPFNLFTPGRRAVREELEALRVHPRIHAAADSHERPMHCHHEKLVIVDDRCAFVGGIDLTSLGGDRFDHPEHPARGELGWHDSAAELRGPAVDVVGEHFRLRWHAVTGERLAAAPPSPPAGDLELQIVRTVPEKIYDALPRGEFSICEAYLGALRSAERLIYIENQFLWSSEVVKVLVEKLRNPPCDAFRLLLVLPAHPNNGGDDTRGQLGVLVEADDADRMFACTVYAGSTRPERVYVHSKITIVDDRWLTIGSANLNEHSLFNDSEMNVVACDPALVRDTRERLFGEHLDLPPAEVRGDPQQLIDERWRPIAEEQLTRLERGLPLTHRLVRLPHVSRRAGRLLGPIQSLIVDG
jgi:phosphatidylserine/phosphatidylglycerophosphate/cardiolipin synthase-like enzyme